MSRSRFESLLQAGLFVAFLALPLLDTALGLDASPLPARVSTVEEPPPRPTDLATLASFAERFEPYYRDHFGWRSWLIGQFHRTNLRLFGVSESPSVHVGRDGWLYYGGTATDYQRANRPFTPYQQRSWRRSIEHRHQWLAEQGIRYLFTIAPNKHSIYPEHLPAKLRRTGEATRWEILSRQLALHRAVTVVDLHAPLLAAKEREQVYERTGSHWNQRGAYLAYREIFDQLAEWFPELEPVAWEALEWGRRGPPGDLSSMLSAARLVDEERLELEGGVRYPDLRFRRNASLTTEQEDASLPRAVIFHDSFSIALAPFLAEHFSHAVFEWRAHFDGELVRRVQPDVVIEQRVERRLLLGAMPNVLPAVPQSP